MPLLVLLIPVVFLIFWIWMFQDMTNNPYLSPDERRTWSLMFLFLNLFAAAWYYFSIYRYRR